MKTLQLKRVTFGEAITFGVLIHEGAPLCVTLEPPWKDNKEDESCIPLGTYLCKRVDSPNFGDTFEITCVPERTDILFHVGNWAKNTDGCVLLGKQFKSLNGSEAPMILYSALAMEIFRDLLKDDNEFKLDVICSYE